MAEQSHQPQDSWSMGMSKLMEAGRANMTAYNLAAAGVAALTAGAVAYMWDQSRRHAVMDGAERFASQMRQAWGLDTATRDEDATPTGHA